MRRFTINRNKTSKAGGVGIKFKGKSAFSLVEVAISATLAGLAIAAALGTAIPLIIRLNSAIQDETAAARRLDSVFAILEQPAELCGYGLSSDPGDYRSRFGVGSAPFSWPGPISIEEISLGGRKRSGGLCRIVYASASGIRNVNESSASATRFVTLLSDAPKLMDTAAGAPRIKNWAVFGAVMPSRYPLRLDKKVQAAQGCHATFTRAGASGDVELTIPRNDELFYLRALELRVRLVTDETGADYTLYTNDHTGSGNQPRVDGIVDARFELVDRKLLRVRVLARGEKKHDRIATPGTPTGWPERYAQDIPEEMRYYKLFAAKRSFELMNM